MIRLIAALGLILLVLTGCRQAKTLGYQVMSERPHDASCYTQGLEFSGERLFESGGLYGRSTLREVDARSGELRRKRPLAPAVFAEGITILQGELFYLTWKENLATVVELDSFKFLRSNTYQGEGWGLANDGRHLIMSDGSNRLRFIDPKTFRELRVLEVKAGGAPVDQLNELEYSNGQIFANIYPTDRIARIDAASGKVTGWLDLSALRKRLGSSDGGEPAEALNGIARDPQSGHLFVTGKHWPKMFEIRVN